MNSHLVIERRLRRGGSSLLKKQKTKKLLPDAELRQVTIMNNFERRIPVSKGGARESKYVLVMTEQ